MSPQASHQKHIIFMRGWLLGREYNVALRAMEYAASFHTGTRKDGETPEYAHQVDIAHFLRTLCGSMRQPEAVLAATFLHDLCEDYNVGFEEVETLFGAEIANAVRRLSKVHRGVKLPTDVYYQELAACPIASIVKPADRNHNVRSMTGVFSHEKQKEYLQETQLYVLPAIKEARKRFPDQEPVYTNLKHSLDTQVHIISKTLRLAGTTI